MIRETRWGPIAQKRPGPPKKGWSQLQRDQRRRFGIAAIMAANAWPTDLATAIHLAEGTDQVPRDILTMAALGRYYEFVNADGTTWTNVTSPVAPGQIGGQETMWQWSAWDAAYSTSYSTSNFCFRGNIIIPLVDRQVTGIRAILRTLDGGSYRAIIATIDGSFTITSLVQTDEITVAGVAQALFNWQIDTTLQVGLTYWIAVGCTNKGAATPLSIVLPDPPKWLWPTLNVNHGRVANQNPTVGTVIDALGTGGITVGLYMPN